LFAVARPVLGVVQIRVAPPVYPAPQLYAGPPVTTGYYRDAPASWLGWQSYWLPAVSDQHRVSSRCTHLLMQLAAPHQATGDVGGLERRTLGW
jgi:hypothetical protein